MTVEGEPVLRQPTGLMLLACLAFVAGLLGCRPEADEAGEIRVGLLVDGGTRGEQPTIRAARLAVTAATDGGWLAVGGTRHRVVLVVEDTQDTPEGAAQAALKLINQQQVAALVGPNVSRNAIPAAEVANYARIPMISPSSTNRQTTAGKEYVFRVAFLDSFQGQVMARFAAMELGAATAAVIYDAANAYSRDVASMFQRVFTAAGGRVVAFESCITGDRDFRDQLLRIRDRRPEVLFLPNSSDEVLAQVTQARELGIDATLLGSDGWVAARTGWQPELEGAFLSIHWHPDVGRDNAEARAFIAAYRRAYDEDPIDMAALAYDAVSLLLHAIRSADRTEPAAIRQGLAEIEHFPGVTGKITYRGTGGDPRKQVAIVQLQEGKVRLRNLVQPEATR